MGSHYNSRHHPRRRCSNRLSRDLARRDRLGGAGLATDVLALGTEELRCGPDAGSLTVCPRRSSRMDQQRLIKRRASTTGIPRPSASATTGGARLSTMPRASWRCTRLSKLTRCDYTGSVCRLAVALMRAFPVPFHQSIDPPGESARAYNARVRCLPPVRSHPHLRLPTGCWRARFGPFGPAKSGLHPRERCLGLPAAAMPGRDGRFRPAPAYPAPHSGEGGRIVTLHCPPVPR